MNRTTDPLSRRIVDVQSAQPHALVAITLRAPNARFCSRIYLMPRHARQVAQHLQTHASLMEALEKRQRYERAKPEPPQCPNNTTLAGPADSSPTTPSNSASAPSTPENPPAPTPPQPAMLTSVGTPASPPTATPAPHVHTPNRTRTNETGHWLGM